MRILRQTFSFAILFSIAAFSAHAASFDCRKARSPDEIAVCHSPELSELDSEMGALWFTYRQLPFLMGMSGVRRDDAGRFLASRAACGPRTGCLHELYRARIKALKQGITSALGDMKRQLGE
jgi:uncharacterized protein